MLLTNLKINNGRTSVDCSGNFPLLGTTTADRAISARKSKKTKSPPGRSSHATQGMARRKGGRVGLGYQKWKAAEATKDSVGALEISKKAYLFLPRLAFRQLRGFTTTVLVSRLVVRVNPSVREWMSECRL
jgi:hypothetical protein